MNVCFFLFSSCFISFVKSIWKLSNVSTESKIDRLQYSILFLCFYYRNTRVGHRTFLMFIWQYFSNYDRLYALPSENDFSKNSYIRWYIQILRATSNINIYFLWKTIHICIFHTHGKYIRNFAITWNHASYFLYSYINKNTTFLTQPFIGKITNFSHKITSIQNHLKITDIDRIVSYCDLPKRTLPFCSGMQRR